MSSLNVKVLGCSGGIGGVELQTTSILVGEQTLIDAGTGVSALTLEQLSAINNLYLTHSHMDHIALCPMLIDSTYDSRQKPLRINALKSTIEDLNKHIFNWKIWPNFSEIVIDGAPQQEIHTISVGQSFALEGGGEIVVGPAKHQVPSCSYLIIGKNKKLFFSGDTSYTSDIVSFIKDHEPVEHVILECAFSNKEKKIAKLSEHMCTEGVLKIISEIGENHNFYITHLKPSQRDLIMDEILGEKINGMEISRLFSYQVFSL